MSSLILKTTSDNYKIKINGSAEELCDSLVDYCVKDEIFWQMILVIVETVSFIKSNDKTQKINE